MSRPLRILQLSTFDVAGGAERVAMNLHLELRARGHEAVLAVGYRKGEEPGVVRVDNDAHRSAWARLWVGLERPPESGGPRSALGLLGIAAGQPGRALEVLRGHEDFDFPATPHLRGLAPGGAEVIHCHNLHGGYFDLRALARLSEEVPVFLTLHDMWLLTGHCAYSLGCERWQTGCGRCPDLTIYPRLLRDGTAYNLERKKAIYRRSRLRVATPSRWLTEKVQRSVLAEGIVESRVIPYGVDLGFFRPGDRLLARADLGIPPEARVLLFAAYGATSNPFKDYATLQAATRLAGERMRGSRLVFLVVGEAGESREEAGVQMRRLPFQKPAALASCYRAADLFLHAAREDNFPNTVLEAQACGTPTVATAVGGIPEQIEDGGSGVLVPPGDPGAMAEAVVRLLEDPGRRVAMSKRAAEVGREFGVAKQVERYIKWFEEACEAWPLK